MTEAELQAIRERYDKAPPGPWSWGKAEDGWGGKAHYRLCAADGTVIFYGAGEHADGTIIIENEPGAALARDCRQDIPALLAEVDRLRAVVAKVDYYGAALIAREYEPGSQVVTELVEAAWAAMEGKP